MIILDTNVLSELSKGNADAQVVAWLRAMTEPPVTTVINRAELLAGVALMPPGRRRDRVLEGIADALGALDICLPLTESGATRYAEVVAARRALGRPVTEMDALIAAIALDAKAQIATRNVKDFEGVGIELVDPWA